MKQPRRLRALVIDDRPRPIAQGPLEPFVTIEFIQSFKDVQATFGDRRKPTSISMAADLLLIDVDLSEAMPRHDEFDWGSQSGRLKPIGPMLALPFIARDLCAFSAYSNHWGDQAVLYNGFVMLSIALLLSAVRREEVSLEEAKAAVVEQVDAGFPQSTREALPLALVQFREVLSSNLVQFINVGLVYQRLIQLQQAAMDTGTKVNIPLRDAEGTLSIDFYLPSAEFDRVELSSLFADKLGFSTPLTPVELEPVLEQLEAWRPRSVENGGETLLSASTGVINSCLDQEMSVFDVIEETRKNRGCDIDKHLLTRIVMEFAWVLAWYEATNHIEKNVSKIARVHDILGLKKRGSESIRYRRLLGTVVDGKDDVSESKWRTPFKKTYSGTNDAYQLDLDEPAMLTSIERGLCIQFAQDELRWDGMDPFKRYPAWMTSSEEFSNE